MIHRLKFGIRSSEFGILRWRVMETPPAIPHSALRAPHWKGSTLTEVLVALMIASIGLVSVATLFPMSVLRSVKAAQTTSATDVRYNAEEAMDRYPDIIKHPDSRNPLYSVIPYPAPPYPAAPTGYTINDVDPPWLQMQLQGIKNYIVDPLGYAAVRNLNLTIGRQQ